MKRGYAIKSLNDSNWNDALCRTERGLFSRKNNFKWKIGQWYSVDGTIETCSNGFHCFRGTGFMGWASWAQTLVLVQVKGDHEVQDRGTENEKFAYRSMRVIKRLKVTQKIVKEWAEIEGIERVEPWLRVWGALRALVHLSDARSVMLGRSFTKYLLETQAPEYL